MKLLIIEDERKLSDSIVTYLSAERYICEQAGVHLRRRDVDAGSL